MKAIRPRETRIWIDQAREAIQRNPFVLKVTDRRIDEKGLEEMDLAIYEIKNFDIEFANNFFYTTDVPNKPTIKIMMVPFKLNGDD